MPMRIGTSRMSLVLSLREKEIDVRPDFSAPVMLQNAPAENENEKMQKSKRSAGAADERAIARAGARRT